MNRANLSSWGYLLGILLMIWLLYLAYKIAQHVNAWPFH